MNTFKINNLICELLKLNPDISKLEDFKKFEDNEWKYLVDLLKKQNIISLFYYKLKENNFVHFIPSQISGDIKKIYQSETIRNLKIKAEVSKLAKEMNKNNIPVLMMKGLHLSNFVYPKLGLRFLKDIDILVPIDKAKDSFYISKNLGFKSTKEIDDTYFSFKYEHHLAPMVKNNEIVLEIHGTINNPKSSFFIEPAIIWENVEKVILDNNEVYILNWEFFIIHLCIHISYQDNFINDLRHYYDFVLILEKYKDKINWKDFVENVERLNIQKGVFIIFKILESLFEIEIPPLIFGLLDETEQKKSEKLISVAINLMWEYKKEPERVEEYTKYRNAVRSYGDFFDSGFLGKASIILKKIFLSKELMIIKYGAVVNSKNIFFYYFINMFDIIKRNSDIFSNSSENNKFRNHVEQVNTLNNWLISK